MSQNLINDLSDRVSALTARVSAAELVAENNRRLAEQVAGETASLIREGRRLAEWLNAIRLEIEARGTNANTETVLHYAQEALSGRDPHWMTDEYLTRARDPRLTHRS